MTRETPLLVENLMTCNDIITPEYGATLCEIFGFSKISEKMRVAGLSNYKPFNFNIRLNDYALSYDVILPHTLQYAYGETSKERKRADDKFLDDLLGIGYGLFKSYFWYIRLRIFGFTKFGHARIEP